MGFALGAALLAVVTAITCALPGVFVVLRRNSMLVDGISHAVFPGIVVGFALTGDLNSPWLIIGAAISGLMVAVGSEWLSRTGLITGDAPQGLIFPALFAVGVIMVSGQFTNVHLDTHVVLVGDLNLASFEHLIVSGRDFGPTYMYLMLGMFLINAVFILLFYRQLKVATFDPEFAELIGIRTRRLNLWLMFLVAVTVTAAFHAAGAILVISLMITPAAVAYLVSDRLPQMFFWTLVVSTIGAIAGFQIAYAFNAATSAAMATFYGLIFVVVLVGTRVVRNRRRRQATDQPGHSNPAPSEPALGSST
ncbi:metal ABC transporter permease [Corynebacterium alimapuense]|uniref:Zinc ABC transporter permease n=1 Tax=Corynebacterium alimapuense TaxID=1576874 RepID=A0A3M8K5Z7_9CORY|nr:metal ABC transporter permease [Corynebacterium alimapuense]RNE48175.1 zinc ABC transporter permease [Corynebacterium alimapuense]